MLASLMQHMVDTDPSPASLAQSADLLRALASDDPLQVQQLLRQAAENGVALAQVGTLALMADRPLVGQVLREHFAIKVEDYRTTGGEAGLSARTGYPTLAALAYMHDQPAQLRALRWGANPDTTWRVSDVMGQYASEKGRKAISWISEAIRGINPKVVKALLAKSSPANIAEQHRRLVALVDATRHSGGDPREDYARIVDFFKPGGTHAIKATFWDVPFGDVSLGMSLADTMLAGTSHAQRLNGQDLLRDWVEESIPQGGHAHCDLLVYGMRATNRHRNPIPRWCVEAMQPAQAQVVLRTGWLDTIYRLIYDPAAAYWSEDQAVESLQRSLSDFDAVKARALPAGETFGSVLGMLGKLEEIPFGKLNARFVAAVAKLWPGPAGQAENETFELVELLSDLASPEPGTDEKVQMRIRLRALREQMKLEAQTPPSPARPRQRL